MNDDFKTSASTANVPEGITAESIIKALDEIVRAMPPDPWGEWMRSQGCPPEVWDLYLPHTIAAKAVNLPNYVKVSRTALAPVFVRRGSTSF